MAIRRDGAVITRVHVPAGRCLDCGELALADAAIEAALDVLERHSSVDDEIVILDEGNQVGSA